MKKILSLIVSYSVLGIFVAGCEQSTSPDDKTQVNEIVLYKIKQKKEIYTYKLESCYAKLPKAHGIIKIEKIEKGYSFDLHATNLEPKIEYALDANELPIEVVNPYTITTEPTAEADKNGNLVMNGVIDLKAGETIYVFTAIGGMFEMRLVAEKPLF